MTPRERFDQLVLEDRFAEAAEVLDANPDLYYLREMLYRVWSYTDKVDTATMGLDQKEEPWR